jgi:proline dehydrogenase
MLTRNLILKTSGFPPIEKMVRGSRLFRPLVSRFIAGDSLEEAIAACEGVVKSGIRVTLDYLGENTATEAEARAAIETYKTMLERIRTVPSFADYFPEDPRLPRDPFNISIKLTQCGLDQGEAFAEANYREVLAVAKAAGNFVRIDMEASDYTERTINMIERVFVDFKNTGTVLQSYLYRTDDDVERMINLGARVRLVKGAYLEPSSVAHPEKAKVDESYIRQAKRLLKDGFYPAMATQDEAIISELKKYVVEQKIDPQSFEWQMLYGIRRDLQDSLLKEGFNVRVYVPFGDSWYPYFTRRLAERPANMVFIAKSLFKG